MIGEARHIDVCVCVCVHLSLCCLCKLPGSVSPIHLYAVATDAAAAAAWHAEISRARAINQLQAKHEQSLFLSWDQCAAVD